MTAEGEIMNIEISLKEINGKEVPAVTSLQMAEAVGKLYLSARNRSQNSTLSYPVIPRR